MVGALCPSLPSFSGRGGQPSRAITVCPRQDVQTDFSAAGALGRPPSREQLGGAAILLPFSFQATWLCWASV